MGTMAYDGDQFAIAASALTRVVAAAPQMGVAWNLLGLSEFELKHYGPARSDLQRAAALANSNDPEVERVASYHLALLLIRDGDFDGATTLLLKQFGAAPTAQVSYALGMAALRVPLLPQEVDPAQEALIQSVGSVVAQQGAGLPPFAQLLAQHPDVPLLRDAYALALERAGEPPKALPVFRDQVRQVPEDAVAWSAIARIEGAEGHASDAKSAQARAAAASRTSGPSATEAILARYALKSAPLNTGGWAPAMQAYASGQYAAAAQQLTAWVSQHPEDGTAWAVLGLSEFHLDQFDNALLHLQRGESLGLHGDPNAIATAQYTAGVLLLRTGDFDHAGEILTAARKLRPDDEQITYALGLAMLRRQGLPPSAPTDSPLVDAAGQVEALLQDSRYDEAFTAFRSLLQRYPSTPFLHYAYGTALIALSEFDEAGAQMRAELLLSPTSPLPYLRLASIALRQHTPAEALGPARRALQLAPSSAEAHYLLGRALLDTGDHTAAIPELEQARTLNPGSPEVHFSLARAYARADREEAAAKERATFAHLNELSQAQKSGSGQQIYAGPRDGSGLTSATPGNSPQ